jgi:uncharacterized protein
MSLQKDGHLLRVYVNENDRCEHMPLYEWILRKAQEKGLAGATVLRGMAGFIASDPIHTQKVLRLSDNLPVVIEIVDHLEKIETFIPILDKVIGEGLVTLERVQVFLYRRR